eukprot:91130-Amphidinium_carterae.1
MDPDDLPLWMPNRIKSKMAKSEEDTGRPFLCLRCFLGMGQPGKRKAFLTMEDLWHHFYSRHMDVVNVQLL